MPEFRYWYNEGYLRDVFSSELEGVTEAGLEELVSRLDSGEVESEINEAIHEVLASYIVNNKDDLKTEDDEEEEG